MHASPMKSITMPTGDLRSVDDYVKFLSNDVYTLYDDDFTISIQGWAIDCDELVNRHL